MKRVILIRHGKQEHGKDEGLSQLGKQQATRTGLYLVEKYRDTGIAGLLASDLKRAKETADGTTNAALREKMNWGDADPNEPFEDFSSLWNATLHDRELKPPGRESSIESGERLDGFLQSLPDDERPYIVVGHGGIFAELLRNHFPNNEIAQHMPHSPDIGQKGWKGFGHGSISELVIDEGGYRMEGLNFTRHLEGGVGEGIISGGHTETGNGTGMVSGEQKG